jgi:glycosyltransferase involved in cell wall biosynthesis
MNRGGLETTLMNIFRNIDREFVIFDFLVLTKNKCAYDDEIRSLGGQIHYIPPRKQGLIKNRRALSEFFNEHKEYKIVHQHASSLSNIEPIIVARREQVPVRIIHSRNTRQGGSYFHKYLHLWNRRKIKSYATDYFACSDLAAKWLYGEKQYIEGEYTIINNGIETEKFVFNTDTRNRVRKEFGIYNKLVLANVGRLHPQKNHKFLLEIFKSVHESNPNTVLMLVGDGPLRNEIEDIIEELNLKEHVILTGVRKDIPSLLQAMDIFVMPSYYEGLPGAIVEAQGAGLPCLISDTITNQVQITDLVHFASLNETSDIWREKVFNILSNSKRRDTRIELEKAGYDMSGIARDLQKFYLNKSRELE